MIRLMMFLVGFTILGLAYVTQGQDYTPPQEHCERWSEGD